MMPKLRKWEAVKLEWAVLSYYQRFESLVAFALTLVVVAIILVALYRLASEVIVGLLLGVLDPLDHRIFQSVFGEIMTLLIALEFNHTLQYVVKREQSIIQTKVVLLIALLAMARKFIILDLGAVSGEQLLGLAAITLVLGVVYWLMRERDDRASSIPHRSQESVR
jgi:uncharacterized membrane protein (DUF373 family)